MLPRKNLLRALCLLLAATIAASSLISSPAQAIGDLPTDSGYTPAVTVNELSVTPSSQISALSVGKRTTSLLPATTVNPFTLVGLTWIGAVSAGTEFKVRVRESGAWSDWFTLEYGEYQGVGNDGSESVDARVGSDPLLTGFADGIEVKMENDSGAVPEQMKVTLVNSEVTKQDQIIGMQSMRMATSGDSLQTLADSQFPTEVISPQGAVVPRPRIVSRAEWGADESWRNRVPRVGTTLLAGIVHHTASTNNYTAAQAPAQMRNLYAYFTQSLKYADMGYNFLVDKYGTIYEGRSGCVVDAVDCDSAAVVAQGAHTAGLNANTFGVSAIGNYDVLAPENPAVIVESIASLMAWKLAPYGLDPNATARILSTDTSGSSKFSSGQIATTQVISAHRDVGKTACPGRYLYPYMDQIRTRAADFLLPVIRDVSVTPVNLNQISAENVNVQATIPATANWSVEVTSEATGQVINSVSGTQGATGAIQFAWNRTDQVGNAVPAGRYSVSIKASIRQIVLPTAGQVITLAPPPKISKEISFKRVSPIKTKVVWNVTSADVAPTTDYSFRISSNGARTWSKWRKASSSEFITSKWRRGQIYYIEFRSSNVMGKSNVVRKKYVVARYAPPKPQPVSKITFIQASNRFVNVSWTPAVSEYESEGFYVRTSINDKKWSPWRYTKSNNAKVSIKAAVGAKVRVQVKEKNFSGFSPTRSRSFVVQ